MKHIWFVVALMSLIAAIHKTWLLGFKDSYLFFIFAIIAFLMYLFRKNMTIPNKKSKP